MHEEDFFKNTDPFALLKKYGSPLYVYSEAILRQRCRELVEAFPRPRFNVFYSVKANANPYLLRVIRQEGLYADAMSPGELFLEKKAGFKAREIFFVSNNVSDEELKTVVEQNISISVDSLSQLERFGTLFPGRAVFVRLNPGVGAGHHDKVITGGEKTKFGVQISDLGKMQVAAKRHNVCIVGLNQHIGSLFLDDSIYLTAAQALLKIAEKIPSVTHVDFGGGFGIDYQRGKGKVRLDVYSLGKKLTELVGGWERKNERTLEVAVESGRYVVAECGRVFGTILARKINGSISYLGTDIGFNVLMRPVLYGAHHDIEVHTRSSKKIQGKEKVTVVGNICESGDILAEDRFLPRASEGDILVVHDAGAYGMSMSSQYNCRLRPAEILIRMDGSIKLIRRPDTVQDLLRPYGIKEA